MRCKDNHTFYRTLALEGDVVDLPVASEGSTYSRAFSKQVRQLEG